MSETESKSKKASARKLQKQRKEGNLPIIADASGLISTAVSLILLVSISSVIIERLSSSVFVVERTMVLPFTSSLEIATKHISTLLALIVLPILGTSLIVSVLTTVIYNKGINFTMKPITPNFGRMSPTSGFKRILGRRSIIETIVSLVRLVIWFGFIGILALIFVSDVFQAVFCGAVCSIDVAFSILTWILTGAILICLVATAFEMILQQNIYLHEQRMTQSESKQEAKEMGGSQEVKQEQRRLRNEAMEGAEASSIDKANMCFFWKDSCVAIRYHPKLAPVPRVAAKAKSKAKSEKLRKVIRENGFREVESLAVVETCINTPIGNAIDKAGQTALVEGLTTMFS